MKTYNVVSNDVMVTLLGEELDREASHITNGVCTALLATSGAKTKEHWSLLANAIEELGRGEGGYVVGDFEFTPGTGSLSMNNSTRR